MRGRSRAAVIALARGHILLIKRYRRGRGTYFVFPGGGVEPGESIEDAARREVREETGLKIGRMRRVFASRTLSGGRQDYFVARTAFMPVALPRSAHERDPQRIKAFGTSTPTWVPIRKLGQLRIYPPEIRVQVQRALRDGFPTSVIDIGTVGFREKRLPTAKRANRRSRLLSVGKR